jgi:chromosomal replication initiator protein
MLEKGKTAAIENMPPAAVSEPHAALGDMWLQVSLQLKSEIGDAAFKSWIAPVSPARLEGGVLSLSAPTRFIRDWVKTHYAERVRQLWAQRFGAVIRVDMAVAAVAAPAVAESPAPAAEAPAAEDAFSSPLDARFTFGNFVTGAPNELAHAAARRVAESDSAVFNPLFLYGGVGLGKTHLMQAIAWEIRAARPGKRVVYMSAEKFMYQFIRALRAKEMVPFKELFRGVDVLMIDDIQFICGKEATQEEFFHTFNALADQGKQIVVSADRPPSDLEGLDERLRSRLGGGLAADLKPTTYELRLAILEKKREMLKRDIPQEVLAFLARRVASNVRELEGALNRLVANAELTGRPLTVETAGDLLHDLLRAHDRRISVDDIQRRVAEHYNIRLADMHSPRRARAVARPRQVAMYLAKALTEHSLPEIGRKFGGRDHTTIMHGVRRIEELVIEDQGIREDVEKLKRAIGG